MAETKYELIKKEHREELEAGLLEEVIREFRKEEVEKDFYKYEVVLQDVWFRTFLSNQEVKDTIHICIDILEELKRMNNEGFNQEELSSLEKKCDNPKWDERGAFWTMAFWNEMCTEGLKKSLSHLDEVQRVGGAYALFMSNPVMISAIISVAEVIIDNFDDEDKYLLSAYFLTRAAMKMHSTEYEDCTKMTD